MIAGIQGEVGERRINPKQLGTILRNDFHLRYRRLDGATVRYQDPTFDCKRQWVSRVLAQFLSDGAIIISIDESHIRSDAAKQYQWQFYRRDHELKKTLREYDRGNNEEDRFERDNLEIRSASHWSNISSELSKRSSKVNSLQGRKRSRTTSQESNVTFQQVQPKRKRGRPRKNPAEPT